MVASVYFISTSSSDPGLNPFSLFEITLNNLTSDGDINEKDFLDRVDILCSIGQTVMISNYQRYYKLLDYLGRFTDERLGIILGVPNLQEIFDPKFYRHLNGGILEGVGKMFNRDIKVYVYPYKPNKKSFGQNNGYKKWKNM